jgi:hypothetical protein
VKHFRSYLPLLALSTLCVPFASAQSSVDFMMGFGWAHASALTGGIDSVDFTACATPGAIGIDGGTCEANPKLNAFFLGFGGDAILWKHFGIGGEVSVQPSRDTYGPLQSRVTLYDFNGIWAPVNSKRVEVLAEGGIGGARTSFSINESGCVGTAVCSTAIEPVGNANHFQVHGGIGVSLFVTDHIFIRPQFDVHYIRNFNTDYGTNFVPQAMVWVGYNFGDRK